MSTARRLVQRSTDLLQEAARRREEAQHGGGGSSRRGGSRVAAGAGGWQHWQHWERLGFVALFAVAWRWCVRAALHHARFPTHAHPWEAALFQAVPVACVALAVLLDVWCGGAARRGSGVGVRRGRGAD